MPGKETTCAKVWGRQRTGLAPGTEIMQIQLEHTVRGVFGGRLVWREKQGPGSRASESTACL